ncbi:MAG: hypothetical protein HQL55_18185 [Magnetococcales bacterium]|nr:hypothetical protein [Magnetococcales bacterium]
MVPTNTQLELNIFSKDRAVILGRELQRLVTKKNLTGITDVVLDISAISSGVCFTLTKLLLGQCQREPHQPNLHLFLSFHPGIDADIETEDNDSISTPFGFLSPGALAEDSDKAKLWIPILSKRKRQALIRIRNEFFRGEVDICPVLPFPAKIPRTGDHFTEEFQSEFEGSWDVDPRNIIYAAEDDPLDLYETILKLHDRRNKAFELNGSQIILSPGGSKVLTLGSMLAAIALDLPVLYVEDASYRLRNVDELDNRSQQARIVHLWLYGDAYPTE